jgi:hypothetical protein
MRCPDVRSPGNHVRQDESSLVECSQRQQAPKLPDVGGYPSRRRQLGGQRIPLDNHQADCLDCHGVSGEGFVQL